MYREDGANIMISRKYILINGIPCILYGAEKTDTVCLYVHGKNGNMEEAEHLASLICDSGYQVFSLELPLHGIRKTGSAEFLPWIVVPELQEVYRYLNDRYKNILLYAVSIGAYFSLLSFKERYFNKVLLVSPILDMERLIYRMMEWANVSYEMLEKEKNIATDFGETLSIEYLWYARKNPILNVPLPLYIMYAGNDQLTERDTVLDFSLRFGGKLNIMENGEHFFHTEEQLAVLDNWIRNILL